MNTFCMLCFCEGAGRSDTDTYYIVLSPAATNLSFKEPEFSFDPVKYPDQITQDKAARLEKLREYGYTVVPLVTGSIGYLPNDMMLQGLQNMYVAAGNEFGVRGVPSKDEKFEASVVPKHPILKPSEVIFGIRDIPLDEQLFAGGEGFEVFLIDKNQDEDNLFYECFEQLPKYFEDADWAMENTAFIFKDENPTLTKEIIIKDLEALGYTRDSKIEIDNWK